MRRVQCAKTTSSKGSGLDLLAQRMNSGHPARLKGFKFLDTCDTQPEFKATTPLSNIEGRYLLHEHYQRSYL